MRVVLSGEDFHRLVSGGVVRHGFKVGPAVEIILEDIGFAAMRGYIESAEMGPDQTPRGVCRGCGCEIAAEAEWCGECLCEEDFD